MEPALLSFVPEAVFSAVGDFTAPDFAESAETVEAAAGEETGADEFAAVSDRSAAAEEARSLGKRFSGAAEEAPGAAPLFAAVLFQEQWFRPTAYHPFYSLKEFHGGQ